MRSFLIGATAAVAFTTASPATAVTIDLSQAGNWTGQPGFFSSIQTFALPGNAINVMLSITQFTADDRGVLLLNSTNAGIHGIDATGIFANSNGTSGSFNFSQGGPTVNRLFNTPGTRNLTVTSGFVLGQNNILTFLGNDTGTGIFGSVLPTAQNASYSFTAILTYDLASAAVPEPATWAIMVLGFGAVGATLRSRRRLSVRYA